MNPPPAASVPAPPTAAPVRPGTYTMLGELIGITAALVLGVSAYMDHLAPNLPWWRWLCTLAAGCALLVLALPGSPPAAEGWARRWARYGAGLVAMLSAAAAVQLFPQVGREVATGVAIGVALVAFALARWIPFAPQDVEALTGTPTAGSALHPRFTVARVAVIVASLAAAVTASWVNSTHHLAGFLLWLTSLATFAAAMWQPAAAADDPDRAPCWSADGGPQLSRRAEAVALALIIMLALALRVTDLRGAPVGINTDEGRMGRYAERMWQQGFPDAFDIGWNVFPHLSYMADYIWVQVLGTSNPNLRLAAATVGTLSLIPVFLWARRWWGNVIGLLTAFLLAINREHMQWSRIGLNNIQQALVAGLMLVAFARVLRKRRWVDWVWLGYATGLAFHTYHAAKLFPALLAGAGILLAVGIRGFWRRYLSGALVGAVACLLLFGPLMVSIYQKWEQFYGGTSNRVDLRYMTEAYHRADFTTVRNYLNSHVLGCLLCFTKIPQPEGAIFDGFIAVPFLLGVGWMLWRWLDPRHLVVLLWSAGILAIGGMITDYPPWKARMLGLLPTVCVIPAVVIGRIRAQLSRWSPTRADLVWLPLLLVWLGAALQRNWYMEFVYWPTAQRGDLMTEICRVIDNTPLPATLYMAGGAVMGEPKVAANDCMIAPQPDRFLVNLPDDPAIVPIPPSNRGTAVLMVSLQQRELLPLIRHYYPDAHCDVAYDGHGTPILTVFTLHPEDIERARGLRATFRSPNRTWSLPEGSTTFAAAGSDSFPVTATWQGQVWVPTPGTYRFRSPGAALSFDGSPPAGEGTWSVSAGWHLIEMNATFERAADRAALEWLPPNATEWSPIPRASLHAHPEIHGLLGRYFARIVPASTATPIAETPDYTRIDNAISFDWNTELDEKPPAPFAARPSTLEWVGTVDLPEGESQQLRVASTTPVQVFVNGTPAAGQPTAPARPSCNREF